MANKSGGPLLDGRLADSLPELYSQTYIKGLTHTFYRYPASSPPELVGALISHFSQPGDLVADPFMGGGTTIIEAMASGRNAIGWDLNSLAVFLARVKTNPLTRPGYERVQTWLRNGPLSLTVEDRWAPHELPERLRTALRSGLAALDALSGRERAFARCALLRLGQWALESNDSVPSTREMTDKLEELVAGMRDGLEELVAAAREHGIKKHDLSRLRRLRRLAAEDAEAVARCFRNESKVRLVVTSPPYPGVHVLYNRWQIAGRRETRAPYWVSGTQDGFASSYYTMGPRTPRGIDQYFDRIQQAFVALRPLLEPDALVMQIVGFSNREEHHPRYLRSMESAGYRQVDIDTGGVPTRRVPNRRWYARDREFDAGREFLTVHTPAE